MEPLKLSLEQQFAIAAFKQQVNLMTHDQAKTFLCELHTQMVVREELYRRMLREQWNIESLPIIDK